jgi:hypothetical protein
MPLTSYGEFWPQRIFSIELAGSYEVWCGLTEPPNQTGGNCISVIFNLIKQHVVFRFKDTGSERKREGRSSPHARFNKPQSIGQLTY